MKKIGRNDKCPCESGKKYKVCCLSKDEVEKKKAKAVFVDGQEEHTEYVDIMMEYFKEEYKDHKVIDISNYLNDDTYTKFQQANYFYKTIMIAQKNEQNQSVFNGRGHYSNDMIIMYRGSYRTFKKEDLAKVAESIDYMIETRNAGKEDKGGH